MSEIVKITTHSDDAVARLPEQYKDKPKMIALMRIFGDRAQDLENAFFDLISNGSIADSSGALLDQIGDVVGQKRNGLADDVYKIRLVARIAQNVSNGGGEELIFIYKTLMQATKVYFNPVFPAGASMTALGGTPIGSIDDIKDALEKSRAGGVSFEYFASADANAFSFLDDPDPTSEGFGDSTDASVGGNFATIL